MASYTGTGHRKRSMEKCQNCRDHKKKCLPEDRNYEKGEKCYECIQRGAECGPNVRCRRHGGGGGGGDGPSSQRAPAPPRSAPPPPAPETEALPTTANYANQSSAVIPSTVDSSIRGPRLNANVSLPRNVDPGVAHGLSELSDTEGPSHPSPKCSSRFARRLVEKFSLLIRFLDLYKHYQDRLRAVVDFRRASFPSSPNEDPEASIRSILGAMKDQYLTVGASIFDLAQREDPCVEQNCLQRLLRSLHLFRHAVRIVQELSGSSMQDGSKLCLLGRRVLMRLVLLCERQGDEDQASDYRRELSCFPHSESRNDSEWGLSRQSSAFIQMSEGMSETFADLDGEHHYVQYLREKSATPFPPIQAALLQSKEIVDYLISEKRANLADIDTLRRQLLHLAAEKNDIALLERILEEEPTLLEARDVWGMTALCIAAYMGHLDFFIRLVDAQASLGVMDSSGRNLLCIASGAGHASIVHYILSKGVDPNEDLICGDTPLHIAAACGRVEICQMLVQHGAKTSKRSHGRTALEAAVEFQRDNVARYLRGLEAPNTGTGSSATQIRATSPVTRSQSSTTQSSSSQFSHRHQQLVSNVLRVSGSAEPVPMSSGYHEVNHIRVQATRHSLNASSNTPLTSAASAESAERQRGSRPSLPISRTPRPSQTPMDMVYEGSSLSNLEEVPNFRRVPRDSLSSPQIWNGPRNFETDLQQILNPAQSTFEQQLGISQPHTQVASLFSSQSSLNTPSSIFASSDLNDTFTEPEFFLNAARSSPGTSRNGSVSGDDIR